MTNVMLTYHATNPAVVGQDLFVYLAAVSTNRDSKRLFFDNLVLTTEPSPDQGTLIFIR